MVTESMGRYKNWLLIATLALSGISVAQASSLVDGSIDAGKAKSLTCSACHGADGNSVNPEWPSLAGQHALYAYEQLLAFKNGTRENVLMTSQAMILSEEDMRDLSVYFEAQSATARAVSDPDLIARGKEIYLAGDSGRDVAACIACHGPAGKGNPASPYPAIAGQYAVYTAKQLRDYASGARESDENQVMRNVASLLTEDDIMAVSSYVQGLYAPSSE